MNKPNIILITTDQQRFDTIQALGNHSIFTPHLNYLVSEGVSFTKCYADCPVCIPSRTTIMTGKKGFESGIIGNMVHKDFMEQMTIDRLTLPARLTDFGYQTKAVGKMHFEPARANYGFEDMELPLDYMRSVHKNINVARPKAHGVGECSIEPVISTVDTKDSITTWTVDQSIDFIETRDPLRPFFMWTSFTKPHPPFDPCRDFWDLYQNIDMPDPIYGDWSEDIEKAPQGFLEGTYQNTNMHLNSIQQVKAVRRAYYSMITQVDYSLGMLFGSLREKNILNDTWVIFTADHGEMLGDHHAAQKNLYFEGSAHIPCIIMPPKNHPMAKLRNTTCDKLVQMADIYPTILSMAGIDTTNDNNTGINLLNGVEEDRVFFGSTVKNQLCVMKDNIKLLYSVAGAHYLMFDLNKDKMEQHNVADCEEYKAIFDELKDLLFNFVKENESDLIVDGELASRAAPPSPGVVDSRWLGFHYNDYSMDVFH